jgi:hypothetical protein
VFCRKGLPSSRGDEEALAEVSRGHNRLDKRSRRPEPVVGCRVEVQCALSRSLARGPESEVADGIRKVRLGTYRAPGTKT